MNFPPSNKISPSTRHGERKMMTFQEWLKEKEKLLTEKKSKKRGATIHSKGGSFVIP